MKLRNPGIKAYFRASSALIILGLVVEIVSLMWIHPLAFAAFAFVGASLVGLGILVYLASLVFAANVPIVSTPTNLCYGPSPRSTRACPIAP